MRSGTTNCSGGALKIRGWIANAWENARSGLWLVPTVCVVGGIVLSTGLLIVDDVTRGGLGREVPLLFGGQPHAGRIVLSTIAGSLITVVSIAYSVTFIAMQQAATQYSPRVLRSFTRDRGNQIVLGTYLGTFTYALLVLRQIRDSTDQRPGFLPALSITVGIVLALTSLGMLIYFIHHTSQSLQPTYLVARLRDDVAAAIEHHFPRSFGERVDANEAESIEERLTGRPLVVRARSEGYFRRLDGDAIVEATVDRANVVEITRRVGEYVTCGSPLARIWADRDVGRACVEAVEGAFTLDRSRSIEQDPLFGVQQIADIGVKALSPAVNDPTTAIESLDHLHSVLVRVLDRGLPGAVRRVRGTLYRLVVPTFEDYVSECLGRTARAAKDQPRVLGHVLEVIGDVAFRSLDERQKRALRAQLGQILDDLDRADASEADLSRLRETAIATIRSLAGLPRPEPEPPQNHEASPGA
jgi:uncharacterized membrane protein